ncbi:CAP-GLY domain-containing linker protein 3, partial [Physocladia obscura]
MDTHKIKIGDRISVVRSGIHSEGTLRFIGTTSFAAGEWIGVELNQSEDRNNDGKVDGVSYFECPPGTGVFVLRDAIVKVLDPITNPVIKNTKKSITDTNVFANAAATTSTTTITATTVANYKLGDRVSVVCNGVQLKGTLRFIGKTRLGPGQWFAVEVGKRNGNNDGSIDGIRYFHCAPSAGVFVRESAIFLPKLPVPATTPTKHVQKHLTISPPHLLSAADPSNQKSFSPNKGKQASINLSNRRIKTVQKDSKSQNIETAVRSQANKDSDSKFETPTDNDNAIGVATASG